MEIGVGLDATLGLTHDQQAEMAAEAARLGYTSVWTNEGPGEDAFQLCLLRWLGSRNAVEGGIGTGISVSPVAARSPFGFAMSAGTLSRITGGKFILGIGTSGAYQPAYRQAWGVHNKSSLGLMREYLTIIRGLVKGEKVSYKGMESSLDGAFLALNPPPNTPVYLAALGPEMLKLGGQLADGICLNWCSAQQVAWSRDMVSDAATQAGRDPAEVPLSEYIRVSVDDDVSIARKALARATLGYAAGFQPRQPGERAQGYRAHFERMGFAEPLARIDQMRLNGAPQDELFDALPDEMLLAVGYFGNASGAAAAVQALSRGLDTAIVRVVAARPAVDSVKAVLEACKPALIKAYA